MQSLCVKIASFSDLFEHNNILSGFFWLQPGHKVKVQSDPLTHVRHLQSTENFDTKGMSAFQVQQKRQANKGQNNKKSHNKSISDDHDGVNPTSSQNPVQQLQEVARKLGVKGLSKR